MPALSRRPVGPFPPTGAVSSGGLQSGCQPPSSPFFLPCRSSSPPLFRAFHQFLTLPLLSVGLFASPLLTGTLLTGTLLTGCNQQTVWFCQEEGNPCANVMVDEIESASQRVHVAVYLFNQQDIADALLSAHDRGVEVQVVVEASEDVPSGGTNFDVVQQLLEAGIRVRDDGNSAIMHNKFTVIDGHEVMTGSYNYTNAATYNNDENLVRLVSSTTNEDFEAEFQRVWALGTDAQLAQRQLAPDTAGGP